MSRVPRTARVPLALTSLLAFGIFAAPTPADEPKAEPEVVAEVAPPEKFNSEQKSHWAYQIPTRPELPAVKEAGWVRNPVDRFILAELEAVELAHSAEADKIALIRRVTFDLTGLPPTPAQVDAFVADARPEAYDLLVDRLLESPQHGERWAQHWLDLAHYADTNGFELDAERPDAWRYRDWVVNALNADMPYDRFLSLQLAGDEVSPGDHDALIATGFGRCGPREVVGGNVDPEVRRQSEMTEVTGTVGSVFLGLTLGCARCHDHKFDALPTTDYYRLQSFFAAATMDDRSIANSAETEAFAAATKDVAAKVAPLRKAMAELEAPYRKVLKATKDATLTADEHKALDTAEKDRTPEQKKTVAGLASSLAIQWPEVAEAVAKVPADHAERERLKREIDAIEQTLPRPPAGAMALADSGKDAPETFVYRRGEVKSKGPKVAPRPPGIVLASLPAGSFPDAIEPGEKTTGRRKALAAWMSRPDNPLTARVIVNRLWAHHFGRGIVATPSDFGVRGEAPTHPELLDWLATELASNGWHLKPLHKLMVTSATYRQASAGDPDRATLDPENTTLWRMNRRRLEAESLRDAMLAVTGELNPKLGGPGVLVPIEREVEDLIFTEAEVVDLWPETPDTAEHARRSLYLYRKRNVRYPMFDAFDAPDTQTACPQRAVSTHALQSLVMLNSDFALSRAGALAGRLYRERQGADDRIRLAYRLILARDPRPAEVDQARAFLASQAERLYGRDPARLAKPDFVPPETPAVAAAAWVDFALAMLNRNEFVYIP